MAGSKRETYRESLEVVWPLGKTITTGKVSAPPLPELQGKVIGGLSNRLFRCDNMLSIIGNGLEERIPDVVFVAPSAFGTFHGSQETSVIANLPEVLRTQGCAAVIAGVGG